MDLIRVEGRAPASPIVGIYRSCLIQRSGIVTVQRNMKQPAKQRKEGKAPPPPPRGPRFALPVVGNLFSIAAGLSVLVLCMILPLVGPAAMRGSGSPGATAVSHARANFLTFLGVLLLSLALSALAIYSKMDRRKIDGSPLPLYTIGLFVLLLLLLIALFIHLLEI